MLYYQKALNELTLINNCYCISINILKLTNTYYFYP